jgi:hypothetical protein
MPAYGSIYSRPIINMHSHASRVEQMLMRCFDITKRNKVACFTANWNAHMNMNMMGEEVRGKLVRPRNNNNNNVKKHVGKPGPKSRRTLLATVFSTVGTVPQGKK